MQQSRSEVTKEKIIHAAAAIISREGIEACTHRAVAAEAGVSIGTTTYQFRTLDDILIAVLDLAVDNFTLETRAWLTRHAALPADQALTRFVQWTLQEMARLNTEYALFVTAVSRPLLRPCALNWLEVHERLLTEHLSLSARQARAAVMLIDALLLRGILQQDEIAADQTMIHPLFSCILQNQ